MFKALVLASAVPALLRGMYDPLQDSCYDPDDNGDKPYCYTLDKQVETCNIEACTKDLRDVQDEAAKVATYVGSHDCGCASQLFGATTTTKDTSVPGALVQLTVAAAKQHKLTMAMVKHNCNCISTA